MGAIFDPRIIFLKLDFHRRGAEVAEDRGAGWHGETDAPSVTLYRRKPEGGFSCELYEGLDPVVPLPEIEVELGLGELYERVVFGG